MHSSRSLTPVSVHDMEMSSEHYDEIFGVEEYVREREFLNEDDNIANSEPEGRAPEQKKPEVKYDYAYNDTVPDGRAEKDHSKASDANSYIEVIGDSHSIIIKEGMCLSFCRCFSF